jgi:vitamin B12 transporter
MTAVRAPSARPALLAAAGMAAFAGIDAAGQSTAVPGGLDEIVVTSSRIGQPRRELGTAVSAIDFDEITLRGYSDLADVLRTQPGIAVSNSGGIGKATSLRIRGEEPYRTTLIIDGVKAVDASAPQVAPSFDSLLSTTDFERVEVLRGPQGFIYGADAGGVVNVLTKRGADELTGQLGIEYGEHDLRKVDAAFSGGGERGDYYVSVTDLATDGFNAQTADTVLRDNDGADNTTWHAKLGWNLSDALRLQLVVRDIDAADDYDGCFSSVTFAVVHDCSATTDQSIYKVSADLNSGAFKNAFGFSNVDIARRDFSEGTLAFATEGESGRLEYTGSYARGAGLTLVYGVDLQRERLVGDSDRFARDQDGYYVEYQGAFDERFFLSVGARYDDNEDFGAHTSSRVSAVYVQPLSGERSLKYRASYGTGFRAPSLYEIAYDRGSFAFPPAAGLVLQEETSEGYDVGIEYDAARNFHVELTYFDQRIEDEIFFDLVTFAGYLQSTGRSRSEGLEVVAAAALGERFELNANVTHNRAEDSASDPRLRRPKELANLSLLYRAPGGRLELVGNYRLSRDAVDAGDIALDDYFVLDVAARYRLSETLELYGRVQNVTDERYQEVLGYNTSRRAAYAGVRLRF